MGRVARKSYETMYFHVIVQGYERQYIFEQEIFKKKYLELIKNEMERYEVELLEYCIMDNHAHMLIYCKEIEQMSKYMKSVNTKFAMFYNMENNRVGYVFRDRFLSEPIMNERYLYKCISYIHMNPVVANIVSRPNEYIYSSYNDFINKKGIVTESVLIKLFGDSEKYMDLFEFLHLTSGEGSEYQDEARMCTINDSQKIVKDILYKFSLAEIDLKDSKMQKYFYSLFLRRGVKLSHIEKIFKVSRRKIGRIMKLG